MRKMFEPFVDFWDVERYPAVVFQYSFCAFIKKSELQTPACLFM